MSLSPYSCRTICNIMRCRRTGRKQHLQFFQAPDSPGLLSVPTPPKENKSQASIFRQLCNLPAKKRWVVRQQTTHTHLPSKFRERCRRCRRGQLPASKQPLRYFPYERHSCAEKKNALGGLLEKGIQLYGHSQSPCTVL